MYFFELFSPGICPGMGLQDHMVALFFSVLRNYHTVLYSESESEAAQSCPTLYDPMDWSLPASSVHGIFQARVLEWVAISFSNKCHPVLVGGPYRIWAS